MDEELRENMCNLDIPGDHPEISRETMGNFLSPSAQYSCQYWVYHLRERGGTAEDGGPEHEFLQKHFLHWLEALGLMGRAWEVTGLILMLKSVLNITGNKSVELSGFPDDALRLVQRNIALINSAPLQVYSSLLLFAPESIRVRLSFMMPNWIKIPTTIAKDWGSCRQVLEGHSSHVNSVDFSPDSSLLISTGSSDETVRLWHTESGKCIRILQSGIGNRDPEKISWSPGAVFSHDSKLVASCWSSAVRVWSAESGICVKEFTYPELGFEGSGFQSVHFSHNSPTKLAFCTGNKILVWFAETDSCQTLQANETYSFQSAAFLQVGDSTFVIASAIQPEVDSSGLITIFPLSAQPEEWIEFIHWPDHPRHAPLLAVLPNSMLFAIIADSTDHGDGVVDMWRIAPRFGGENEGAISISKDAQVEPVCKLELGPATLAGVFSRVSARFA
ncbi:WD40-repeat-containing domain protein [Lasiosphaeris hirsuta]|uniref:WD40-repeat-containing domain protein n=1 Tax=Lasiosphaeris hirsuta TaxID=260670 RepID=A0AA40A802_9PEZI|nr:WD40-repeat-containing domain protein [Lasiosphaeris hirsuta]